MKLNKMKKLSAIPLLLICLSLQAQDIRLPSPVKTGGKPLMDVLAQRKSNREFSEKELSLQQLSDLLWAANGISREDGRRTAPSARNKQQIDIYAFTAKGIYRYDYAGHTLKFIKSGDFRPEIAMNAFAHSAPLLLVYVADYNKMEDMNQEAREFYGATDCGNVSQNVYLYCASENLNTVAIGSIHRDKIKELTGFNGKAILGQPVGFPK